MQVQAADQYYLNQQRLAVTTTAAAKMLWSRMDDDFDGSWSRIGPAMLETVQLGRTAAANTSTQVTGLILAETDQKAPAVAVVSPAAFVASAPDGRPMGSLLTEAVVQTKLAVKEGSDVTEALFIGDRWLTAMILTVMADTSRSVVSADITSRPTLTGYVRMLNPPSCPRCVILAGKWFRWNQGFQRHPRCFPAGVVVSGPSADAASRRWYEGELIILHTASGERLPVTGNHPILTDHGWVPANLLNEGHSVVRSTLSEGAAPLVVPNEKQSPALIEDVWGADRMGGLSRVETSPEDFHGDGMHGEVDIVFADRNLRGGLVSASGEPVEHGLLSLGVDAPGAFVGASASHENVDALLGTSDGIVRGADLRGKLAAGHFASANLASVGVTSDWYADLDEASANHISSHSKLFSEAVLALTGRVLRRDEVDGQDDVSPRWDAPSAPFSVESGGAYASRGEDLRLRLAGQVELDRVVQVERVQWSGHVYNLTSSEGWYVANGLIVSNCDCRHIPAASEAWAKAEGFISDPYEYFRSFSNQEQERIWGRIEARAIRDGADIYRVENIRLRGLGTAKGNLRYGTPSRVTIDDIYRTAGNRTNAIKMMEREGYITGPQTPGGNILGAREGFGALGKGGNARAASTAVLDARNTGVRDPLNRYTMTSAERRLYDAQYRLNEARTTGNWPRSIGANSADRNVRPTPLKTGDLQTLERALQNEISKLPTAPESVKRLARLLGLL